MVLAAALLALGAAKPLPPEFVVHGQALCPKGASAPARVLFNAADAHHAYALEIGPKLAKLLKLAAGKESLLAGPVPIALGSKPSVVLIQRRKEAIRCRIGAGAVLAAKDATFAAGALRGQAAKAGIVLKSFRVQRVAPIAFNDDFMRSKGDPDGWAQLAGEWAIDQLPNPDWSMNAFRYLGRGKGECLAAAGQWFWSDYAARVAVQPGQDAKEFGLALYVEDARNYVALRWAAQRSRLELVHRVNGQETLLAQKPGRLDGKQWYEFAAAAARDRVAAFLDGRRVFDVAAPGLMGGKVGLYCRGASGARFDDAAVASIPPGRGLTASVVPRRRTVVAERFREDHYMQEWASELGSWAPADGDPGLFWHVGLFPADVRMAWTGHQPMPFAQGPIEVLLALESHDAKQGYTIPIQRGPRTGRITAQLLRQGKSVAAWRLDWPPGKPAPPLAIERHGSTIRATLGDKTLGQFTDPQPLGTRRLGLRCQWQTARGLKHYSALNEHDYKVRLPAVQDFAAECPQVRDYSFHCAPVDWFADTGVWEVTSRWICLPMFTWLGGRSHEAAVLWHKHEFAGDTVVDLQAAVMMNYGPMSGYVRYGDINLTLCADGSDLSSGYSFIYGGYANTATRILRRSKVVAASRRYLYPSRSQGAHGHWYHLRAEKCGKRIRFFVGNQLACEFIDPQPLQGKRVAVWTWNRGVMLARARIWADSDMGANSLRPPAPRRAPKPAAPRIAVASESHPVVHYGFDRDTEGWANRTGEHGGAPAWEPRGRGGCLRVSNPKTGGDFAVYAPLARFDAAKLSRLSFDYRIPAHVKIGLYFRCLGKWHVVGLTGPTGPAFHRVTESRNISGRKTATTGLQLQQPAPVVLGRLSVVADGKWRSTEFGLLGALQTAYPNERHFEVGDLHFANWSNADYLQCGFTGNPKGAAYWIDNVLLAGHGRGAGAFACRLDGAKRWAWAIDQSPTTAPDLRKARHESKITFKGLKSGKWFMHVRTDAAMRHVPFLVDEAAPRVAAVEPAANAKAAATQLAIHLSGPGGAGVDPRSVRVKIAGRRAPADRVTVRASRVVVDLRDRVFASNQRVVCELSAADRAGNAMPKPFRWAWTYDYAQDRALPSRPTLAGPLTSDWDEDFESPSNEWGKMPGSAWVEAKLDDSAAARSGRRSLRIEGGPGPFRCYLRREPFDVRSRPLLCFDVMHEPGAGWELGLKTDKGWWAVSGSRGRSYWPVIGRLPYPAASAGWRGMELDIDSLLRQADAYGEPVVYAVAVAAPRLLGGQTTVLRFDDMRAAPLVFGKPGFRLSWRSRDTSGIAGYSFAVDRRRDTTPPAKVMAREGSATIAGASFGRLFLHCRAQDRAGNWGPVLHQPLFVKRTADAAPPVVSDVAPKPGSRAAAYVIRARIRDVLTGVSPARTVLTINGKRYTPLSPELRFLPGQDLLEWRAAEAPGFPNGQAVACKLETADLAGNALAKPIEWTWTMDDRLDKTPPGAPFVTWRPANALVHTDFEAGPGQWMGRREGWAAVTDGFAAAGRRCISFGGFSTFMHYQRYDARRYPIVGFDYRLEPGARLNLMVRIENRNWVILFNSPGNKYPIIGEVPGVVADGQWHSCRFDLAAMLPHAPLPPAGTLVDHLATLNRTPHTFHVDNFFIAAKGQPGVVLKWAAPRDSAGVKGYSFVLDHSPATVPDTAIDGADRQMQYPGLEPGLWWFHVAACDRAGNWGAAAHLKIDTRPSDAKP